MVPRMTLGLPVPVMRGIVAVLVVLKCLVEAGKREIVNKEGVVEVRDLEHSSEHEVVKARRYRS